jgi:hypothetical protein
MRQKTVKMTDYLGRELWLKQQRFAIANNSCTQEEYLYAALEFPDEVYFYKHLHMNRYIKYYQDFYVDVMVNLNEYSSKKGIENRIIGWKMENESINYPSESLSEKLLTHCGGGKMIYRYVPPYYLS